MADLAGLKGRRWVSRKPQPSKDDFIYVIFEPPDLIARLRELVQPPRLNLTLVHGLLASHSPWRVGLGIQVPPSMEATA